VRKSTVTEREDHLNRRQNWLAQALVATLECDLIFVDPDNGIRRTEHAEPRHRTKSVKHAYLDELEAFAIRGQSVVAYHHADRSASVAQQAMLRLSDLAEDMSVEPLAAVRASRGTTRLFLVAANALHVDHLTSRLLALKSSKWSSELIVYWWPTRAGGPFARP